MKVVVLRENLKNALFAVSGASGGGQLPILKNVLFSAKGGEVCISATNLTLGIVSCFSAKVEKEGAAALPFSLFSSLITGVSHEKITLETKERGLLVTTAVSESAIQIADEKEFPIIPGVSNSGLVAKVEGKKLKEALEQVVGAAALATDFRPALAGVYFDFQPDVLLCVATDSFRLAEKKVRDSYVFCSERGATCLVPARNAQEIIKILPAGEVTIALDEHQFGLSCDSLRVVSRIIDAKFPDYKAIIPSHFATTVTVSAEELFEGLRVSSAFTGRLRDVKLAVSENKKTLALFSKNAGVGETTWRAAAKCEGEATEAVFNVSYIADGIRAALRSGKEDKIVLSLNHGNYPSHIALINDQSFSYVLMPIKSL